MRRAPQGGQNPRRLQLNATSLSWPQSPQRSLRKPWARMPHSRKASNSSLMNRGSSAPVLGSVWAMKLAACCCTRRYSVVCSGRWRSYGTAARSGTRRGCCTVACTHCSRRAAGRPTPSMKIPRTRRQRPQPRRHVHQGGWLDFAVCHRRPAGVANERAALGVDDCQVRVVGGEGACRGRSRRPQAARARAESSGTRDRTQYRARAARDDS